MQITTGDCVGTMRGMPENSVDSVVTDPPYGLAFMGKKWDVVNQHWHEAWAREVLRVLKPGGYLLAFGGTRTYHRLACAIEDAGFEIRDSISWLYGSGFPKSHDVSKAIDKMGGTNISWFAPWLKVERKKRGMSAKALAEYFKTSPERINHGGCVSNWELGLNVPTVKQFNKLCEVLDLPFERLEEAEREVVGKNTNVQRAACIVQASGGGNIAFGAGSLNDDITTPATPQAQQWQGWGTALKPAHESIVMARKPLSESSVARNVLEHGTGAINVDGCRVGNGSDKSPGGNIDQDRIARAGYSGDIARHAPTDYKTGRWPANLILSHAPECERVGVKRARSGDSKVSESTPSRVKGGLGGKVSAHYADPDGTEEVEAWECVDGCPVAELDRQSGTLKSGGKADNTFKRTDVGYHGGCQPYESAGYYSDKGGASRFFYVAKASRKERGEDNNHPTVKPIALMRDLVRMVTPPGGTVLDPFAGSGSTGCAAVLEGMDFIGIEREEEYVEIAKRRISHYQQELEERLFL